MTFQPIVIAVMGPAGSGKTNFINKLTGIREEALQLRTHTQAIKEYTVNKDRQYVFVDFPGFDDTCRPDRDILRTIAEWLEKKYRANVKLSGIVYTHCITDNLTPRSVCKNLEMFSRLCGDKAAGGVRLVTTMWDRVKSREPAERAVMHIETVWKPLIDAGARHKRFEENSWRCAWGIIQDLTGEGKALLLQEELVDLKRGLNETTVGQDLYKRFQKLQHEQKKRIKQLQEETKGQRDRELVKAEQQRIQAEVQQTQEEMKKLEISTFRRLVLRCAENTLPASAITVEQDIFAEAADCVNESDCVIFVVGPTEEKTWFITQLLKNHDCGRHPHTASVAAWRCNLGNGPDNIIVVDTPSFDSNRNALDGENAMGNWLESKFSNKCHSAILVLHSLDSDPTIGDRLLSWHLETLAKASRNEFAVPPDIHIVPTRNPDSTLHRETLNQRLSQLEIIIEGLNGTDEHAWHATIFPGVFEGQQETAWSAALLLLKGITQAQTQEYSASPLPSSQRMSPDTRLMLKGVADSLFREFVEKKRERDLDAIIMLGKTALEFAPLEYPQRHLALADLLLERFNNEGRNEDLDELIRLKRTASEYMSPGEPQRQTILLQLDSYLSERFLRSDSRVDLEEIISLRRAALARTPHPDRCRALLKLASALHDQFKRQGTENSIAEAVSLVRAALGLCSPPHPDHALCRDRLASYVQAKVERMAHLRGLDACSSSASSFDIKRSIKEAVSDKVKNIPPRLLHTPSGVLCNRDVQVSRFEDSHQYKQLLSLSFLLDKKPLESEIDIVVSEYFEFTTLSHRWGSGEPLLRDVQGICIDDLGSTDGGAKLQMFCAFALQRNLQWAWSDTCCIDKDSSAELQEAIGSMFSWYHWSSLTIVHLPDVFVTGSLADSVWFTRGWTLQELLASHTVHFYSQNWSLYMNNNATNHKTVPAMLEELQNATGIAERHLTNFAPGMDDARSRLRWASGRRTTRPEDIAYSLFGIFEVHLSIFYGESTHNALGRLLAEIISRSGDVSVLDWVGESSSFNSCFPVDLAPYQTVPQFQPIPSDLSRRNDVDREKAQELYRELARVPRAGFVNRRLTLPSTAHPVTAVELQDSSIRPLRYTYEIHASRLRPLKVTLSVELRDSVDTYILVRPWHPKTLEQQSDRDIDAVWELLEQLEQPFNALLLKRLLCNEYKRIACDCAITACVQDLDCILDSEVLIPEIV